MASLAFLFSFVSLNHLSQVFNTFTHDQVTYLQVTRTYQYTKLNSIVIPQTYTIKITLYAPRNIA